MVQACCSTRSLVTGGVGDGFGDVLFEMSVKELQDALGVKHSHSASFLVRSIIRWF